MPMPTLILAALLAACGPTQEPMGAPLVQEQVNLRVGAWRAWLDSPGGELPFELDLSEGNGTWQAWIRNGQERIAVDEVRVEDDRLVLDILHYGAKIEANWDERGQTLQGTWSVRKANDSVDSLPFRAHWKTARRFTPLRVVGPPGDVKGRWRVQFASDPELAVASFAQKPGAVEVEGTFLTTTGDYRFLAGTLESDVLRLSAFDGAHAFLFQATLADGVLTGDFWSGSRWHDTWTARRDEAVALPDPMALTTATEAVDWAALSFPDLDGKSRSLADPQWAAEPRLIQIMGSWCPNCNDQTDLLVELNRAHPSLQIVSLAFEHGNPARNTATVRKYQEHHGAPWTYLVAGLSDKGAASAALPILDRVRAYPTLLFVDRKGAIQAIDTGFIGPAAPAEHAALRARYDALITQLMAPDSTENPAE